MGAAGLNRAPPAARGDASCPGSADRRAVCQVRSHMYDEVRPEASQNDPEAIPMMISTASVLSIFSTRGDGRRGSRSCELTRPPYMARSGCVWRLFEDFDEAK
ncbi:hypothetical protein GCM10017744_006150 [Streptomyces antimycoticus]|uniref:Uncharacterized protein n=1 Tax=Streptomyces antimycoticus TaxID=68175 RepID=A0A4D4KNM0_9ACTN|nr:hypothetical protein SANT12839_093680 [Streptomyces antimycoticus]